MNENIKFRVYANEGEIVVCEQGCVEMNLSHRPTDLYSDIKLVLAFDDKSELGTVGDCIVRPDFYKWGLFETGEGFVLMRFDFHVHWLFWAGTYPNGKSIVPCVRFADAIRYKTKAKALVALAVLNVDKEYLSYG